LIDSESDNSTGNAECEMKGKYLSPLTFVKIDYIYLDADRGNEEENEG
jgi:hypothetical protein